jgi:prepilin-type N-terminal cleavage/methylation domain-containing protein
MIRPRKNVPTNRSGFTLLELAVALVIIGVLASLVAPRFAQSMTANRAEMAARRLTADLRRVQDTARITSSSLVVRFTVSPTASLYEVPGLPDLDHRGGHYVVRLHDDPYVVEISGVSLGGDAELVFDGQGKPDTAGTITLRAGDHVRTIAIDGPSGHTAVAASKL